MFESFNIAKSFNKTKSFTRRIQKLQKNFENFPLE